MYLNIKNEVSTAEFPELFTGLSAVLFSYKLFPVISSF